MVVFLCTLFLAGCWDRREINDIAIVLTTAIDKEPNGYRVSVLFPLPGNLGGPAGGGGGSGGQKPFAIDTEVGKTLFEATSKLQTRLSRQLYFSHRRLILIGEEFARSDLSNMFDGIARHPESRMTTFIAITKGKAYELMNAPTRIERFSVEEIRELVQSNATLPTRLKDVFNKVNTKGVDVYYPYFEVVDPPLKKASSSHIQASGFAISHYGKMVGVLKGKDALGLRLLADKFRPYTEITQVDNKRVAVEISHAQKSIKPVLVGKDIRFDITVKAEATVVESNLKKDLGIPANLSKIEEAIEKNIRSQMEQTIRVLQQKKSDAVGFGQSLYRSFPDRWNSGLKENWYAAFQTCTFQIKVDCQIYRMGMLRENVLK